jgi:hypothetical protein
MKVSDRFVRRLWVRDDFRDFGHATNGGNVRA